MNIQMLMQQAKQMQKQLEEKMKKTKEELATIEVEGTAGQGLVKVTMTCRYVVKRVHIDPSLLSDDAEILEDLIAAATNDAFRQAEKIADEKNAAATGGMVPPGMGGLF